MSPIHAAVYFESAPFDQGVGVEAWELGTTAVQYYSYSHGRYTCGYQLRA